MIQIAPAYGRDYSSKQAVIEALRKGSDFMIMDIMHRDNGRMIGLSGLRDFTTVNVRYNKLQRVAVIEVASL